MYVYEVIRPVEMLPKWGNKINIGSELRSRKEIFIFIK